MSIVSVHQILETLNPPQREAAEHVDGPLLILAGAGSGKTRVIVCRTAQLIARGVAPWNILAVTFTNKAAAEMRQRVNTLCPGSGAAVWVSTFHAFCAKFLRVEAKNVGLDPNFVIYDDNDQMAIIKEILKEMMLTDKECAPRQVLSAISRAKDDMLDSGSYLIHAQAHADPFRERVGRIYEAYSKKLKASMALDFGDLIMKSVEAFRDNERVREKYQKRFRYLMVDEYQDTNHAQYLLTKYLAGPEKNICVVGDDDQSIYSWRGATIRNILEFERDYPGAKVVKLEQNYRSSSKIIEAASRLIQLNTRRKEKKMWTDNAPGEDVVFVEMANEQEEARYVMDQVSALRGRGVNLKDIAIFYRTNAQSRVFEDALRRLAVPYTIVGALRFYERAEIKDAVAYLRAVVNPKDSLSLKRVVNLPARGLGKNSQSLLEQYAATQGISLWETFQQSAQVAGISPAARAGVKNFVELIERFQKISEEQPASTVVRRMLEESGYWDKWASVADEDPEAAERLDNLQELINAAKDFEERTKADQGDPLPTVARFLQEVSLMTDLDDWEDQGGTLTLMTVHLAKGLEFPAVFVTGLEEGLFPIGDAAFDQDELEEERRLAYVAMTRAREKLYLTSAASRRIFGTPRMNIPSRFIEEAGVASVRSAQNSGGWGKTSSMSDDDFNQTLGVSEDMNQDVGEASPSAPLALPRVRRLPKVGQRVTHPDFGQGKVLDVEGSGDHAKVTILFNNGSKKKLLLKYAPLEF
ncbi:MAG: ATP-dependent DNA helicase PcrA [Elusimicrobia bacterium]|nr:ATP-dependent DNA helicase PcrA [Elusimicrobiota bacterium]